MPRTYMGETRYMEKLLESGIVRGKTEEIQEIYSRAPKLELPFLDLMTARDLLQVSGYEDDASLLAVLLSLFRALEEGSLCLDLHGESLRAGLSAFLGEEKARQLAEVFLSGLLKGRYRGLIAGRPDEYLPLVLSELDGERLLYFHKLYLHEEMLRRRVKALLTEDDRFTIPEQRVDAALEEVFSPALSIRVSRGGPAIVRDELQTRAIRLALRSRFSIVSGGPGTGKTSLMVNMLRCLVRTGVKAERIFLGAPTGRAAQRMTEAVRFSMSTIEEPSPKDLELSGLKGSTLHKMLRYQSRNNDFYYGEANPLPASVIVLDEVSMVDLVMMEKFLRAVDPSRTRLIFLGDKDQLPSVEAGAVFAEMIPDGTRARSFEGRLTVLEKVYRSGAGLLDLAGQVNSGTCPELTPVPFDRALGLEPDRWAFVRSRGREAWREHIRAWAEARYLGTKRGTGKSLLDLAGEAGRMNHAGLTDSTGGRELMGEIFNLIEGSRILSLTRNGIYGSIGINREIARFLAPDSRAWTGEGFFSGAVIMIRRNDYSRELFNGDVGVVIRGGDGVYRAFFPRNGSYISYSMELLPPWEPAFAMTVHKAQGSEFDDVLLVLPEDQDHRLLTREIVYTGITRAKKRLIIFGSESALNRALQRKIQRRSGFRW